MPGKAVGFIGVGLMGGAMAERLLAGGFPLVVFDTDPANLAPFLEEGAQPAATAREVADKAEIVFSCLPNTGASLSVALGENGVKGGTAIEVYVDTGTIGTEVAQKLAEGLAGTCAFIDAPISGGPNGARAGTLTTIVSGPQEAFESVRPYLSIIAKHIFHVGTVAGQAQLAKLINNHLSAAGRLAAFEGLVLGMKAGIDPAVLLDVINNSTGFNHTTRSKIPMAVQSGVFAYGARLANSLKDEGLLIEQAKALDVPLWFAPRILETLKEAAAAGYLNQDSMFVMQYMGEMAGIDARAIMEGKTGK